MIIVIWAITIMFGLISLFTSNIAPLIAALILAVMGTLAERFYK